MTEPTSSLAELLSMVEQSLGGERTLELSQHLGAQPPATDSGAPPEVGVASTPKRIVVVGAGVAGLTLAYELAERGADVELWEASARTGGRNLTVRPGDVIKEDGQPDQTCQLPAGSYFNAGPGRISHQHRAVLHYCKKFGLELRPYQTLNRSALLHRWLPELDKDVVVRNRQVQFDGQGRIGELAARIGQWSEPNSPVSPELEQGLQDWLHDQFDVFKTTQGDWQYRAGGKQGFVIPRGAASEPGQAERPLTLEQILGLRLWYDDPRRSPDVIDEQLSMFELEGGNDALIIALTKALEGRLKLGRCLKKLTRLEGGQVKLVGLDSESGHQVETIVDRVVLALQPQAMATMELDLPQERLEGLRSLPPRSAVKVGGWMQRRFWEDDLAIYGGISFTNLPNQQIWYPNNGFHDAAGGLLVMAYAALDHGEALGKMSPQERCAAVVAMAERIHPQIREELDPATLLTIAWQNMPHIKSPWVAWTPDKYQKWFRTLTEPCGSVAFAGDWCSHLPAWQEGAIRSAYALLPWGLHD